MKRPARPGAQIGQPAIDFHLEDLAGQAHHLADFRGHWLLLVFHRHLG